MVTLRLWAGRHRRVETAKGTALVNCFSMDKKERQIRCKAANQLSYTYHNYYTWPIHFIACIPSRSRPANCSELRSSYKVSSPNMAPRNIPSSLRTCRACLKRLCWHSNTIAVRSYEHIRVLCLLLSTSPIGQNARLQPQNLSMKIQQGGPAGAL